MTDKEIGPANVGAPKSRALRAGIVGAGLMGGWHARTIERVGGQVAAVFDTDEAAARQLAHRHHGAQAFGSKSYAGLFADGDLDVLHICTPLPTHQQIAEIALDAGLHLIIEKPLTPGAEATRQLLERAATRGLIVCPVHQMVFQDGMRQARHWLPRLGRLLHLDSVFCSAGGTGRSGSDLDAIVADILPHPLSLMQVLLPSGLPPDGFRAMRPGCGELRVTGMGQDCTWSIFISMNARPTASLLRLLGTHGTIHLDLFHGFAFIEPGQVSRLKKIMHPFDMSLRNLSAATLNLGQRAARGEPAYPGLRSLTASFYDAVTLGTGSPISADDTLAVALARDGMLHRALSSNSDE